MHRALLQVAITQGCWLRHHVCLELRELSACKRNHGFHQFPACPCEMNLDRHIQGLFKKIFYFLKFIYFNWRLITLKLKLQYFGHLMRRVDSLEKTLMLGGIGGWRRRGQQRMSGWMASPTRWAWVWVKSGSWWWTGRPGMLRFMGSQRVGHDWATELNYFTIL